LKKKGKCRRSPRGKGGWPNAIRGGGHLQIAEPLKEKKHKGESWRPESFAKNFSGKHGNRSGRKNCTRSSSGKPVGNKKKKKKKKIALGSSTKRDSKPRKGKSFGKKKGGLKGANSQLEAVGGKRSSQEKVE